MNISSRATSGGILSRLPSVSSGIGLKELTTPTSSAQQQQQAKKFRNSEINRSLTLYRKGVVSKKELLDTIDQHRPELLADVAPVGNLLHELIRRGHTKSLLQVIVPHFPEAVLATEQDQDGKKVTLLRQAVIRKDRSLTDVIIKAIGFMLQHSVDDAPESREAMFHTLMKIEDWKMAFLEYPTLLDDAAVHSLFELHASDPRVISPSEDYVDDFRVNLALNETRTLGSSSAFPPGFWANGFKQKKHTTIFTQGLHFLYSPADHGQNSQMEDSTTFDPRASSVFPFGDYPVSVEQQDSDHPDNHSILYNDVTETSGVEVDAFFIAFPSALRPGKNSLLKLFCNLYEQTSKTWLFENDAIAIIIDFKWEAFGAPIYKFYLYVNLLLAINYSLSSAYIMPLLDSKRPQDRALGILWQIFLLVNAFPLVLQEYFQIRYSGFRSYIRQGWNYLDIVIIALVYITVALRFTLVDYFDVYHLMGAVASLLLWFKLVAYLRGLRDTGPLVRMIAQIVIASRFFLLVLTISIIGFGNCLYLIFQIDVHNEESVGTTGSVINTSYGTIFHTFLVLFGALNGNYDFTPFNSSSFNTLTSCVFVLYCACNTIILLNLLIALMGDCYDRVQEYAVAQGRYEQALSILQIESMLPRSILRDNRFFPRWVQVLKPKLGSGDAEAEPWTGKIRQIYRKIDMTEKRLATHITSIDKKLGSMEKSLAIAFNPALLSVDEDLGTESVEGLTPFARTTKGRLGTPLNEADVEPVISITPYVSLSTPSTPGGVVAGDGKGEGEPAEPAIKTTSVAAADDDDDSGDSDAMVSPLENVANSSLGVGMGSVSLPSTPLAFQDVHRRMTRLEDKMDDLLSLLLKQHAGAATNGNSSSTSISR